MPSFRRNSQSQPAILPSTKQNAQRSNSIANEKWQEVHARSEEVRQIRLEEADASLPNMFQKLRRNSKQIFQSSPSGSSKRADDTPVSSMNYLNLGKGKLTFFDLPPEIRNVIYEDIAQETRLYVSCSLPKKKDKDPKNPPHQTPALLLVSKQARLEYLPLLLECATISFAVRDFDFRNLVRVSSSLYSSELKALRKNAHLTVRLLATKCSKDALTSLRRWAQRRTEDMYTLPLFYELAWPREKQLVPTSSSVHRINCYIQRRGVLQQNLEGLAGLGKEVPEALQWEMRPVVEVFEREMGALNGGGVVDPWGDERWVGAMFGRRG